MRYTFIKREFPGNNPIANALVIVAGGLIISVALVLGFFAFLALGALILVTAAIISIRVWWLGRKIHSDGSAGNAQAGRPAPPAGVIEGEFKVVDEDSDKRR